MKIVSSSSSSAIIYKDEDISYSELISNIQGVAGLNTFDPGSKVIIFMENRPDWIYSVFSVWENKGTAVLVDYLSSVEELQYIIKDSGAKKLVISRETEAVAKRAISNLEIEILNVDKISYTSGRVPEYLEYGEDEDAEKVAVIMYTSGTTGDPKGVMLTFSNLDANVEALRKTRIVESRDTILALLYFHHSYPFMSLILVPLSVRARIVIAASIGSDEIFNLLDRHSISIIVGVPRLLSLMAKGIMKEILSGYISSKVYYIMKKIGTKPLRRKVFDKVHQKFGGKIKHFQSGGAKLDPEAAEILTTMGFTILEGYGLSESSPVISTCTFRNNRLGSVGKPLDNVEVKVVNGELLAKGPNIMKGYFGKEEETKKIIKNSWLHTGDLGHIDSDGYIYITGRKNEMIVLTNGKNIDPISIEKEIVSSVRYIKEIGIFLKDGRLAAIIYPDHKLLAEDKIINIDEAIKWPLTDEYNSKVSDYKRISEYFIVNEELPKTRLGKLKRFMLPSLAVKRDVEINEDEPENEVYRIMKKYLESVSSRKVSLNSHVELDLGLDSIDKVDMQHFIERVFGITISAEEMAHMMTFDKFYQFVDKKKEFINRDEVSKRGILSSKDKISKSKVDLAKPNVSLMNFSKFIFKPLFNFMFNLETSGLENIPKDGNFIMAPNHQSYLDSALLASFLPLDIMKDTYSLAYYGSFKSNIMKKLAKNINVIILDIDKNLKEVIESLEVVLDKNKNLLIFPEGAITRSGELFDFRSLYALLSKRYNVPIVPVVINGAYKALPINSSVPKFEKISVKILPAVYPDKFKDHKTLSDKVYKAIDSELVKEKSVNDK